MKLFLLGAVAMVLAQGIAVILILWRTGVAHQRDYERLQALTKQKENEHFRRTHCASCGDLLAGEGEPPCYCHPCFHGYRGFVSNRNDSPEAP